MGVKLAECQTSKGVNLPEYLLYLQFGRMLDETKTLVVPVVVVIVSQ